MTGLDGLKQEELIQNLRDAGCGDELIKRFLQLWASGRCQQGLGLLMRHRQVLLERCHREERRIDCLDYLVYQMSSRSDKQQGRNTETEA